MTKLKKRKLFKWAGISALSFGALSMPIGLVLACNREAMQESPIWYNGQVFKSTYDLGEYAKQNLTKKASTVDQSRWLIKDGNANRTFNNPSELTTFLRTNYISEKQSYVDDNFYQSLDGERLTNVALTDDANQIKRVYRGNDDSIYFTEKDAQDSLIEEHELFYFDNKYFATRADLSSYLRSADFDTKKLTARGEVLTSQAQDGSLRQSGIITPDQTSSASGNFTISNFVRGNAERVYGANHQAISKLSPEDIDINDVPYLKVPNTNGKASYVMDLKNDVNGFLIGPYVLEGAVDPTTTILKKDYWQASNINYETSAYQKSLEDLTLDTVINLALASENITSFSDLLMRDLSSNEAFVEYNEAHPVLPNTNEANKEVTYYDGSTFAKLLRDQSVYMPGAKSMGSLAEFLAKTEANLASGKNFGFLRSLSALRSWLIAQVITNRLKVSFVEEINRQFDKVARYINFKTHQMLDALVSAKAQAFNLARIFNFANRQSFGENPASYLNALKNGKLITNDDVGANVPEAKELLLAAPFALGVMSYINDRTKVINGRLMTIEAQKLAHENALEAERLYKPTQYDAWIDQKVPPLSLSPRLNYELPGNLDDITPYLGEQSKELELLNVALKNLEQFEKDDIDNANTLRTTSDNYLEFKERINLYLTYQRASLQYLLPENAKQWNLDDLSTGLQVNSGPNNSADAVRAKVQSLLTATKFVKDKLDFVVKVAEATQKSIKKTIEIVKTAASQAGKVLKWVKVGAIFLAAAVVLLEVINFILDIIGKTVIDTYWYDYDQGTANYYWNGGSHTARSILGFDFNTDYQTMRDYALIYPVTIANASITDSYYYDGRFYPTDLALRQAFLNNLKNDVHPELTSYEIRLVNRNAIGSYYVPLRASSLEELARGATGFLKILPSVKTGVSVTPHGFYDNEQLAVNERISTLLGQIKPLSVIQLPVIDEQTNAPKRLEAYYVPATASRPLWGLNAKSFTSDDQAAIARRTYLIFDPNLDEAYENRLAINQMIRNEFSTKFNIATKDVLASSLSQTKRFSKLANVLNASSDNSSGYITQNIFEVRSPRGHIERFVNEGAALGWILAALDFQVIANIGQNEVIVIDDIVYASISEFVSKVLLNQEVHRKEIRV